MEIFIILLIVGIPLLGIFVFELKKRKIDFKALKSFDFSIVEFFENNLQKISKNNLFQKIQQKTKHFRKQQKTKKFSGHRNPPPPPIHSATRITRSQTRPYVDPAKESVTALLEKMRDDFLDNPYLDKFYVEDSDISFKFETGEILKIVDKNYKKELVYINNSKTHNILLTSAQSINVLKMYKDLSENTRERIMTTYNGVTFTKDSVDGVKSQYDNWSYDEDKKSKRSDDEIAYDNLSTLYDVKKAQLDSLQQNDLEYSLRKKELNAIQTNLNTLKIKINKK